MAGAARELAHRSNWVLLGVEQGEGRRGLCNCMGADWLLCAHVGAGVLHGTHFLMNLTGDCKAQGQLCLLS